MIGIAQLVHNALESGMYQNLQFDVGIALWSLSISVFGPIAGETRVRPG